MSKYQIIERMLNPGVVAVIRADSSEQLMDVAKALAAGGVTAMYRAAGHHVALDLSGGDMPGDRFIDVPIA